MITNNLTTQWLPISERRKNACSKVSAQFINQNRAKGWNIDEYTAEFIDSIFQRILVGPKAYRVYDAHDPNSVWHDKAIENIKEGTLHHMYLKDNNLQHGLVRDSWCKQLLSTGLTKEETVYNIAEIIIKHEFFLRFVIKAGINRRIS